MEVRSGGRRQAAEFIVKAMGVAILMMALSYGGRFCGDLFTPEEISASRQLASTVFGFVSVLFSIVLGLLVSAGHQKFNAFRTDIQKIVSSLMHVGYILRHLGANSGESLRAVVVLAENIRDRIWTGGGERKFRSYDSIFADLELITRSMNEIGGDIEHRSEVVELRGLLAEIMNVQLTVFRETRNRVPILLLSVVFGWACLIFFFLGFAMRPGVASFYIVLAGALSVAGAYYLILELSHPFAGLFSISSDMFDLSIRHIRAGTRPDPSSAAPATAE